MAAENTEIAKKLHELAGDQNVTLKQKLVAEDTEIATNVHELAGEQDVALKRKLDAEITQIATKLHKSAEDQTVILKRKLVDENTNIASKVQTLAEDCFARKDTVVDLNKEITELPATEEKSRKITKKHETDIKLVLPRSESKRFTLRNRIHIYNSKRWKECKEKALRKKEKQKLCRGRLQSKKGKHTITTREGKDKAETSARLSTAEDFVENQTSSLLGNSVSCHANSKHQKSMKFNFFI